MTAQPAGTDPVHLSAYDVIHVDGGDEAVVVPIAEFQRLQALEQAASAGQLEDAEDIAALQDLQARQDAGLTSYVPADEVRRRLGLTG